MKEKIIWYPWLMDIIRNVYYGDIKYRLPMMGEREKSLSLVLNGPSLNNTIKYIDPLKTDIMMVNDAILTPVFGMLRPQYVCFADPFYAKKSAYLLKIRKELEQSGRQETIIFFPHYLRNQNIFSESKFNVKYIFAPECPYRLGVASDKLLKKNLMAPWFHNVAIMALYVGIQLGYKQINLYGADENFMKEIGVDKDNRVISKAKHYYGNSEKCLNYEGVDMECMFRMMHIMFAWFKSLRKYAEKNNVRILNMSQESWIDCFERFNIN